MTITSLNGVFKSHFFLNSCFPKMKFYRGSGPLKYVLRIDSVPVTLAFR